MLNGGTAQEVHDSMAAIDEGLAADYQAQMDQAVPTLPD